MRPLDDFNEYPAAELIPSSTTERRKLDPDDVKARLSRLEEQISTLTSNQKELIEQTQAISSILSAAKGAFQVLDFIGKIVKPLIWIAMTAAAVGTAITHHKP